MVLDDQRIENKIDKISDEIKEIVKTVAVTEQKLREINHRMGDGQQRNVFSHDLLRNEMTKRLDVIDATLAAKVSIEEYKNTLSGIKDTLAKYQKTLIIISTILVTGSGLIANMPDIKKLIMFIFGMH